MTLLAHLSNHWNDLPWGSETEWVERLERDNVLRHAAALDMAAGARLVRNELDDLAVLLLFSVFEATVRELVEEQVEPEISALRHPALVKAGKDVRRAIEEGSFFQLLEPYKSSMHVDLVEQVNQVRRFRNWVAHGRRPEMNPGAVVEPREAYERLKAFLAVIQPASATSP